MTKEALEKARLLIGAVQDELRLGTKHYNKAGELLASAREIIEEMTQNGKVTIEPVESRKHLFRVN